MTNFQPIAVDRNGVTIPYNVGQYIVATVPFSDGTTTYDVGVYVDMPSGRKQLTMQGAQGERGPAGAQGQQGIQGPQGIQGERGPAGTNGRSYEINGQVNSPADLPTPSATYLGEAFFVGTTEPRLVYACVEYNGVIQWENQGTLQGPPGPQGEQGPQGTQGPEGIQGPQGEQGPQGVPGKSFDENGDYQGVTVGNATNSVNAENATNAVNAQMATADADGNNIENTYVKISDFDRLILENEYPVGGKPYIQFAGMVPPAQRWTNTTWEIDTEYAGRTLVGFGTTGNPLYKGEYSSTTQYYQNEIVSDSGSYYMAIQNTQGNAPTNTTYWTTYQNGVTGGEAKHKQTIEETPVHSHKIQVSSTGWFPSNANPNSVIYNGAGDGVAQNGTITDAYGEYRSGALLQSAGKGKPFNIMQLYKVVAVWKRTA